MRISSEFAFSRYKHQVDELRQWKEHSGAVDVKAEVIVLKEQIRTVVAVPDFSVLKEQVKQLVDAKDKRSNRAWAIVPPILGALPRANFRLHLSELPAQACPYNSSNRPGSCEENHPLKLAKYRDASNAQLVPNMILVPAPR